MTPRRGRVAAWAVVVGLALACPARSQESREEKAAAEAAAEAEFGRLFTEGVRLGVEAASPKEVGAAIERLDAAAALVDQLSEERRGPARFALGVRKAEILLRRGLDARALEVATETRQRARAEETAEDAPPLYSGYYRVLLLTVLRGAMPRPEFTRLVETGGEAGFLFAPATLETVRTKQRGRLYLPLQLMRCDVLESRGLGLQALAVLQKVADEVRDDTKVPSDWRRECLRRLVWFLNERGEYDRAEIYLPALDPFDQSYVRGLAALQRDDADVLVREGRRLVELGGPGSKLVGYHLMGEGLERQQRIEAARAEYEQALAHAGTPDRRAVEINSIGDCHRLAGRLDEAEAKYDEALAILSKLDGKGEEAQRAENQVDLGLLAEKRGHPSKAYQWFSAALDELDRSRRDLPVDVLGSSWFRGPYVTGAIDGVLRTCAGAGHDSFEALAATERGKARGLLDWLHSPPRPEAVAGLQAAVRDLAQVTDPSQLDQRRLALERARSLAREAGLRGAGSLSPDDLRRMLRSEPATVFLSYWSGESGAVLFVGEGGSGSLQRVELGSRADALRHLRAAYEAVADPGPDPWPALDAAAAFFLPDAARSALAGAKLVVFCPDAWTSRLPFEALRVAGESLGRTHDVERAPSLSVRAVLETRDAKGDAVVVVDSVETHDLESFGVEPLEFSRLEGDQTCDHYSRGTGHPIVRLRGADASFEALDAALRATPASLLHISSHGIAAPYVPSGSLLLLANGPVSMASLAGLSLEGAVVVLSACSTATGEARGGEGVAGLLWGPMAAGARSVIASLWMVNQEATAELMNEFHGARVVGMGEARALRFARNALASSTRFEHPHYWAGFAAYGSRPSNPRSDLDEPTRVSGLSVVLGALGAMIVLSLWRVLTGFGGMTRGGKRQARA